MDINHPKPAGSGTVKPANKPVQPLYPIPVEVLYDTLRRYESNTFVRYLTANAPYPFGRDDMEKVIALYYIGTVDLGSWAHSGSHKGFATTFPFIDRFHNVRAIQAKKFDDGGHSAGQPTFIHSIIERRCERRNTEVPEWVARYKTNASKVSCLFGEHLLDKYPYNPVALVEAPKTAIIATLYFGFPGEAPDKPLWLAAGSLGYLNGQRCRALEGRNVYLFPDLSNGGTAYKRWSDRARQLRRQIPGAKFTVSDLLEDNAPERDRFDGYDLADYLLPFDWRSFRYGDPLLY